MKRSFVVRVEMPEGCTVPEMVSYIRDAVQTMAKSYDPRDSIFYLNDDTVSVKPIPEKRKEGV